MNTESATIAALIGNRIEELENGMGNPYFPSDMPYWNDFIENNLQEGGGDNIVVPIITNSPTVTVATTYKTSVSFNDITIADKLEFDYEYLYSNIDVFDQEVRQAKNRGGGKAIADLFDLRIKNAGDAFKKKLNEGLFTGNGSSSMSGFQAFWYDTTYGGQTRTTYASRLDAASATLKTAGGNGTKFTDATAGDGTSILDALYEMYYSVSVTGDAVKWVFLDNINFGKIRRKCADNQVVNLAELNKHGGSTGKAPQQGLIFESAYIVGVDPAFITRGHCFGINAQYTACAALEGYAPNKMRPIAVVPRYDYIGAKNVQFQAGFKVYTNAPTKHFWATQLGMA